MKINTKKFIDSLEGSCKDLYSFKGRTNRYDYFAFMFVFWGLGYVVAALIEIIKLITSTNHFPDWIVLASTALWMLVIIPPSLAITFRRLHDVGRSGGWFLISITVIGILLFMYWTCKRSAPTNKYGELSHSPDTGLVLMLLYMGIITIEFSMFIMTELLPIFIR